MQAHEIAGTDVLLTPNAPLPMPEAEVPGRRRRRSDVGLWMAAGWLIVVVLLAVLADVLPLSDPRALHAAAGRTGPTTEHWLGTDQLSRDQLSRVAYGARVSLVVGLGTALIASVIGSVLGLIAGYRRRRDEHPDHGRDGHPAQRAGAHPRHRADDVPRVGHQQRDPGHLHPRRPGVRPRGAGPDDELRRAAVRQGVQGARRHHPLHPVPRDRAQHHGHRSPRTRWSPPPSPSSSKRASASSASACRPTCPRGAA